MRTQDLARIPIVLGVVGHRDIHPKAKEKLTEALHKIFTQFDTAFPNSPKVLLSPLAPGADQLAATVALYHMGQRARDNRRKDWYVRAPLSFPPDDLLKSTSFMKSHRGESVVMDVDSQKTFKSLQDENDNAVEWFMLPMPEEVPLQWELNTITETQNGVAKKDTKGNWSITLTKPNTIIIEDTVSLEWEFNGDERIHVGIATKYPNGQWSITTKDPDLNKLPDMLNIRLNHEAIREVRHGIAKKDGERNWSVTAEGFPSKTLDWMDILQSKKETNPEAAALRSAFYAHPGGYIVRHCHTLIALWDNKYVRLPSGTHESVRFQLGGLPLSQYPSATAEPLGFDSDRGPVILLYTPRENDPLGNRENASDSDLANAGKELVRVPCGSDDQSGLHYGRQVSLAKLAELNTTTRKLKKLWTRIKLAWGQKKNHSPKYYPNFSRILTSSAEYDQFLSICQAIEDYNTDVLKIPKNDKKYLDRLDSIKKDLDILFHESDPLVPRHEASIQVWQPGSSAPIKPNLKEWFYRLSVVRETAAFLSGNLSKKADIAPVALMVGLLAVIAILHAYAHPPWHFDPHEHPTHHIELLTLFYLGWVLLAASVCYFWYHRLDDKRSDYRALAEALRIRQVWAASGLEGSVADSFVPQLRSELIWIRRALQHICPPPPFWKLQFDELPSKRKLARFNWVKTKWVQEQLKYHGKRNHKLHKTGNFWRRCAFLCFLSGIAVLALPYCLPEHENSISSFDHGQSEHPPQISDHEDTEEIGTSEQPIIITTTIITASSTNTITTKTTTKTSLKATSETSTTTTDSDHKRSFWGYFGTKEHPALFILFSGGLLIGIGGIIVAIVEKLGIEILARSHEQSYLVFRGGSRELEVALNPRILQLFKDKKPETPAIDLQEVPKSVDIDARSVEHAQKIIEALGKEAALESAQWLMLRRSKPLELPLGG